MQTSGAVRRENAKVYPQASLRAKRSNPILPLRGEMDCFALLAMTVERLFEI
jgi:hypothetical protein